MLITHDYPDKKVVLDVHKVADFSGEPKLEGQEGQWVLLNQLPALDFPDANKVIIDKLLSEFN